MSGAVDEWCNLRVVQSTSGTVDEWCSRRVVQSTCVSVYEWCSRRVFQSTIRAVDEWCSRRVVQSTIGPGCYRVCVSSLRVRCCLFCRLHALRREPEVAHHCHVSDEPSNQRRRGRLLLQARARVSGQCDVRLKLKYQVTVTSHTFTGLSRLQVTCGQCRAKQSRLLGAWCT